MDLKTKMNRIITIIKQISIEPLMFFVMFGYFVRATTFQDLLVNRSCRILLGYSDVICSNLNEKKYVAQKAEALTYGVNLSTGCLLFATIPALVVSTFLGPWSDKYGRKYTLVVSIVGVLIQLTMDVFFTLSKNMSPYYFLLSSLFAGIGGGLIVTISCIYSYMSNATDEKSRPTRFAILEFFSIMAMPLGTIIGGKVYKAGGYVSVMVVAAASVGCAMIWLFFMVKENNENRIGKSRRELLRDLFTLDNIIKSFKTAVMKREGNLRLQIWLLILISVIMRMVTIGTASVEYFYVNWVFDWDVPIFSDSTTGFQFLTAITTLAVVPTFNLRFFLHEAAVGLIGAFSLMAKCIVLAVAVKPALVYYGMCCGILYACVGIATRSRMSKLVTKTELGSIFSLIATCEALSPVLGSSIMNQLFNAAKLSYPGLPFAVASFFLVPVAIIFMWMMKLPTVSFGSYCAEMQDIQQEKSESKDVSTTKKASFRERASQEFKEIPL